MEHVLSYQEVLDHSNIVFGLPFVKSFSDLTNLSPCTSLKCCGGMYHCPLCSRAPQKRCMMISHLRKVHWNKRANIKDGKFSLPCYCHHGGISFRHFHCPCMTVVSRKIRFDTHYAKCQAECPLPGDDFCNVVESSVEISSTNTVITEVVAGRHSSQNKPHKYLAKEDIQNIYSWTISFHEDSKMNYARNGDFTKVKSQDDNTVSREEACHLADTQSGLGALLPNVVEDQNEIGIGETNARPNSSAHQSSGGDSYMTEKDTLAEVNNSYLAMAPFLKSFSDLIQLSRCTQAQCCSGLYHCPLCPIYIKKPVKRDKILSHLMSVHWKRRVEIRNGQFAVPCFLQHDEYSLPRRHFHCPCGIVINKRRSSDKHYKKCQQRNGEKELLARKCGDHNVSTMVEKVTEYDDHDYCGRRVPGAKLTRSKEESHENCLGVAHFCTVVDYNNGICCVSRTTTGLLALIHVMKQTSGLSDCELKKCRDERIRHNLEGNCAWECLHVRSTHKANFSPAATLNFGILDQMAKLGLVDDDMKMAVLELRDIAIQKGAQFIVPVLGPVKWAECIKYFSVFTDKNKNWCPMGRTIVKYDTKSNLFDCRCCIGCVTSCSHKVASMWCTLTYNPAAFVTEDGVEQMDT